MTTVIADGRSDWSIINVSRECDVCGWAAQELRTYLHRISGVELPTADRVGDCPAIVLGLRLDLPLIEYAMLPRAAAGHDGFGMCIDESANKIVIGGDNERGVVYGVYELLERLGCRWFYPAQDPDDPEIVPVLDRVEFERALMAVASPIPTRICNASSFFFDIDPAVMKKQIDVAMKARYNGMGWQCDHATYVGEQYEELVESGVIGEIKNRGMLFHGPAHSFQHFLPTERYFDEHPKWFGMRDGKRVPQAYGGAQFCWSNAKARKTFVENAERFILQSPAIDIFCTLSFDGGPACECPKCAKSTPGDLVFNLVNELIERLAVSAPHVRVETSGGYNPVHDPPLATNAHDAMRIVWAHWGRHHGMGFDDPSYRLIGNLELWREAARGGLTLCMYYTDNFATPWISAPYAKVIEGDRRYILDRRVDGIYMLMWPKGYWWNHSLNHYLAGRCFYDARATPMALLSDYAMHYFGPDAGPLLLAYYEQWATEIDLPYRVKDDSRERDRDMLADQRRRWIDPAVAAVAGDAVLVHRVGKVEKLHGAAERLTEAHRMRDDIEELRAAGDWDGAHDLLDEAKDYTDRLIEHIAGLAELEQGLIDRNEVPTFMTMTIKGWIEGEEAAIAAGDRTLRRRGQWGVPDSATVLPAEVTGGLAGLHQ